MPATRKVPPTSGKRGRLAPLHEKSNEALRMEHPSEAENFIVGRFPSACPNCGRNSWSEYERLELFRPQGHEQPIHTALAAYCNECGLMRLHSVEWAERKYKKLWGPPTT